MGDDGAVKSHFECGVCGKPCDVALMHLGGYCSELHKRQLIDENREEKEALLKEGVETVPEEFDLESFERYVLKVSLHMIASLPPKEKLRWRKKNPILLVPEELALEIKERVVKLLPLDYVSTLDAEGHERLFHGGVFQFKKKVPRNVILDAMVRGHIFKRAPEAGDP